MLETSIENVTRTVCHTLKTHDKRLVSAESCTGGLLASYLTSFAGASSFFERGFITYSNQAKQDLLNIDDHTLKSYGAVSRETAAAMAQGALANSRSDIAVSITGVAGPDGGTAEKPVGLVCFGLCGHAISPVTEEGHFDGSRETIRMQSVLNCLKMLMRYIEPESEL
jgi:nicotinamide-nucleotide amidase